MIKYRLDQELVSRKIVESRSQAENYIKLGEVQVDGRVITKPSFFVSSKNSIVITADDRYVSRAGLKLASVAQDFNLDFTGKVVMDVGSSTGGFTDYALQHGAKKVIAIDVGTKQLHASLRLNNNIELHEQTDIRHFLPTQKIDIVVIDVSFISLREILPHIASIAQNAIVVAMVKPQFESGATLKNKGVIKNERLRRNILKEFELWVKNLFVVLDKSDSKITGTKGNQERFYLLQPKK